MDGAGSRAPDHLDDLDRGRAPHNRIVDEDDALTVKIGPARIMLQSNAEVANLIGRLDKGPSDVVVADDSELEGQPRFLGISKRRRDASIGNGDDDIRVDMALAREFDADAFARLVDAGPLDDAVGASKIDMLEDAETAVAVAERHHAADPARRDDDNFPGLDVALEFGADNVQRTRLRGQDPRIAQPTEDQRPHPEWVAHTDDLALRDRHQRIGALNLPQRIGQAVDDGVLEARGNQMDDDLGVAGRLEQAAATHQLPAQLIGVCQIAVVADREPAELEIGEKRLHVAQRDLAGCRIANMADRSVAGQSPDDFLGAEIIADVA